MPKPSRRFDSRSPAGGSATPQLIRLVVGLLLVLALMYVAWQKSQERPQQGGQQPARPAPGVDRPVEIKTIKPDRPAEERGEKPAVTTQIEEMRILDQGGKVVFEGTIELKETLERISRGERGSHGNDGSVFQNREKRLPMKPAGYYREWVHPTPGLRGPGPQRIVTGQAGEIYYTPDHYETFRRIDGAGD